MNKPKPVQYRYVVFFMRVTIIQILITSASLMLGYAFDSSGQEVLDRRVTLAVEKKEIKEVLARIESQIDVKFTYRPRMVNVRRIVSLTTQDLRLEELLTDLFEGNIDISVIGKQVILKPGSKPIEVGSRSVAINPSDADTHITGQVLDAENQPIPGVNILVKGTSIGTTSDAEGRYALDVPDGNDVLVFSFIGYAAQEVSISGRTTIDVTLAADIQQLSEVVVVGYGEQKKATVTGSVTSVKSDVITQAPVNNLSNALVGRMPGVIFVNRSGEPGYDGSQIRVRGTNTSGNPSALIVIDGIANRSGGLERLNPADIESITVLKDASAAIYGAQAANGVILVTTKRGKTGKPEISINYNIGFNTPTRLPEVTDAATYATMMNEIDVHKGSTPRYSDAEIQMYRDGSDPWKYPNTDWYGAVIKPVSLQDNLNLSISGGTDNVKYYVSLGSVSEDGFYKNSATKYKQYNFRSNIDAKITDYFQLSIDLAGRQESRHFPTRPAGTIFRMLIRGKPNLPAYWPNGLPGPDIENGDNPVVISTEATGTDQDDNYVFQSNLRGKIDVPWVKGLNVILNASFDQGYRPRKVFATPWYLYTWDYLTYDAQGEPALEKSKRGLSAPQLTENFEHTSGTTLNAYLNYTKDIGAHAVGFMIGVEKQTLQGNHFNAFRNAYLSASVPQLFAGGDNASKTNGNDESKLYSTARLNYFGRLNYSYNEKYLLEMVWRYDASYIFPEDTRAGFFPGFSAGWVLSEENFMDGAVFINRLKLRGSWGQLGNDRMHPTDARQDEFQFMSLFDYGGGYIFNYNTLSTSIFPESIPNPNITWEVANNSNIGLEGTFFEGKIALEFDYFHNKRSQMLIPRNASVPSTGGFTPPNENIGELVNRGVDFMLMYNGKAGNLSFNIGINGGYAKNEIIFWDEAAGTLPWQRETGMPYNSGLFYNAIGVFKDEAAVSAYPNFTSNTKPGDIIFEDYNEDGVIDGDDRVRQSYNNIPKFQGGLTLGANYKGFDLNILFQGATGAKQYIRTQSGDFGNYLQDFADKRWTPENPNSEHPRTFNREDEYWVSQANTYWYRSTDYLRLKNVQLGYSFAPTLTKKVGLRSARLYVNAINLFTIDTFKVFDPETDNQDGTVYPQKKTYNIGINLTF